MNNPSRVFSPLRSGVLVLAITVLTSANLPAQGIEEFVISGDAARRALTRTEISVATAERIAKACAAYAEENGFAVSISIVSPSGSIVYAYRMDGQNPVNIDTGLYKAQTALYMRASTHEAANRYNMEARVTRVKLDQYFVSGGLPIVVDDQLIGAIGVGGSRLGDEPCAHAALTEVIGPQPPLLEEE